MGEAEAESERWEIIYKISMGIAKALDHLHSELQKPLAHGNLKSKNILLDRNFEPHVSDFGLHLLLNPAANQELLRVSADSGYKAPELIKMTDADERTDVYSYGKILLELLLYGKDQPSNRNSPPDGDGGDCGVSDDRILRCSRIVEACCSSSPDLRPNFKEVIAKIEEIGRIKID